MVKAYRFAAALSLGMLLATPVIAQQTNEQDRKETRAELKQQEKTDKAQAKADKAERKAEGSHKVKKAAREQDKADAQAAKPQ